MRLIHALQEEPRTSVMGGCAPASDEDRARYNLRLALQPNESGFASYLERGATMVWLSTQPPLNWGSKTRMPAHEELIFYYHVFIRFLFLFIYPFWGCIWCLLLDCLIKIIYFGGQKFRLMLCHRFLKRAFLF